MKSFFSIIKISPNPIAGDSLAVGLLMRTENKIWLEFSKSKLTIANKLMGDCKGAIDFSLKQIKYKIDNLNNEIEDDKLQLNDLYSSVEPEYFTYLSKYSNGLLQFSSPKFLDTEISQDKFESLLRTFVDKEFKYLTSVSLYNEDLRSNLIDDSSENTRIKLVRKLEDKVHTNIELNSNVIPDLYFKYKMECLGKNGVITGAKVLDMNSKEETIEREAYHYLVLINTLKRNFDGKKENNFFLISDEPSDISSKKHKIWTALSREKDFKVKDSEEVEEVADIILESNASKFLEAAM